MKLTDFTSIVNYAQDYRGALDYEDEQSARKKLERVVDKHTCEKVVWYLKKVAVHQFDMTAELTEIIHKEIIGLEQQIERLNK